MEHMLSTTRFMSMKKNYIVILCILIFLSLCGCKSDTNNAEKSETERKYFEIRRINSDENLCDGDYYLYHTGKNIYCFSLSEQKQIDLGLSDVNDYTLYNDWVYYAYKEESKYEIRRINCKTLEDEVFVPAENLISLDSDINEKRVFIDIYADNLWLNIYDRDADIYIIPITESDDIEITRLTTTDDKSGEIQIFRFEDVIYERYYVDNRNLYLEKSFRDAYSGLELMDCELDIHVIVNDKDYLLYKDVLTGKFYCQENGGIDRVEIDCICKFIYEDSNFYRKKITVEDGKIIGQMSVVTDWRYADNPTNGRLKKDILFRFTPETGESEIIFDTKTNEVRIIGYKEETVYLFKDYKVISQNLDGENETILFEVEKGNDYIFDWQAGYLVVIKNESEDEIVKAYKVE